MEKVFHANGNEKKAAVAILISDKIDFKTRDKEETLHYDKRINPRRKYNNYKYICMWVFFPIINGIYFYYMYIIYNIYIIYI